MLEASRRAPGQPLTRLLQAQTAQLKGDRVAAREIFKDMVEDPQTRIAGLRGLYIEAEREGEEEAAHQIAERARTEAPSAPWAARALLRHQTAAADWDGALATLSGAADGRILDKRTARRQRAVILTAKALAKEDGEPDVARQAAQEAHDLAPDLVPAAVVAGRLFARQGDIRRATRILEASWKANPHPEIADAYMHVRAGDSATDRLKRAETLFRMRPLADEGRHAVARAAIDARDFARAREVLTPILDAAPDAEGADPDGRARGGGDRRPRPRARMAGARRACAARSGVDGGRHRAGGMGAGLAGQRQARCGRMEGAGRRDRRPADRDRQGRACARFRATIASGAREIEAPAGERRGETRLSRRAGCRRARQGQRAGPARRP